MAGLQPQKSCDGWQAGSHFEEGQRITLEGYEMAPKRREKLQVMEWGEGACLLVPMLVIIPQQFIAGVAEWVILKLYNVYYNYYNVRHLVYFCKHVFNLSLQNLVWPHVQSTSLWEKEERTCTSDWPSSKLRWSCLHEQIRIAPKSVNFHCHSCNSKF